MVGVIVVVDVLVTSAYKARSSAFKTTFKTSSTSSSFVCPFVVTTDSDVIVASSTLIFDFLQIRVRMTSEASATVSERSNGTRNGIVNSFEDT